jgi:hypothetical protein
MTNCAKCGRGGVESSSGICAACYSRESPWGFVGDPGSVVYVPPVEALTKREYFALKVWLEIADPTQSPDDLAEAAVDYADALIAKLAEGTGGARG